MQNHFLQLMPTNGEVVPYSVLFMMILGGLCCHAMIKSCANQVFMLGRSDDAMLVLNIHRIIVLLYTYTQATSGHEMCGLGTRLVHTLLIRFD